MISQNVERSQKTLERQKQFFIANRNNNKRLFSFDLKLVIEGYTHSFQQKHLISLINDCCEKLIGKYGVAKLGITVKKIDQFSGTCILTLIDVSNELIFQLWTALSFYSKKGVRISIVDFIEINNKE